jgi:DNA repair protein RadC
LCRAPGTLIDDAASFIPGTDVPGYYLSSFQDWLQGGLPFQPKMCGAHEVETQLRLIWSPHMDQIEEFLALCLNCANRILGWAKISQGGLSGMVANPKIIFQVALKSNACSIILAHNHPSGNAQPSETDIQLTWKLTECGKFLDLPVLDH